MKLKQLKVKDLMPGDFFYFCDESFFHKYKSNSQHMDGYKLLKSSHTNTSTKAGIEYQILYMIGIRPSEDFVYPRLESIELSANTLVFLEEGEEPEEGHRFIHEWHSFLIRELSNPGIMTDQLSLLLQAICELEKILQIYIDEEEEAEEFDDEDF